MRAGDRTVRLQVGDTHVLLHAAATTMTLDLHLPNSSAFRVFFALSDTLHRTLQSAREKLESDASR